MKQICPNCDVSLRSRSSVELVSNTGKKWYHLTTEPTEFYYLCKSCGVSLSRKGDYISVIPTYLVMFFLLLGKDTLFPKEMIWKIGLPLGLLAGALSYLMSFYVVRYERRNE